MKNRLLVAVLGNRDSGKSTTWNYLFNATVKTGKHERPLFLNKSQYVDVFLVNGSAEERERDIEDLLPQANSDIVLCSTQYRNDVTQTFDYFFKHDYNVLVQWLNPGYKDQRQYLDTLKLIDFLLFKGATVQVRDGSIVPGERVNELRQYILGWATRRNLLRTTWPE